MKPAKNSLQLAIEKYGAIILGSLILAFGIYNIHSRCDVSEGGVLGLSLLAYQWLHISPGISCLVMDLLAFAAGTIVLKKTFLWDSIFSAVVYAIIYAILEHFPPMLPDLSGNPMVASVAGALFVGGGTALIVRQGCAAGADDSLALVFRKLTGVNVGVFYVVSDVLVLGLSLSYIPFRRIIWSLLTVMISSGLIAVLTTDWKTRN